MNRRDLLAATAAASLVGAGSGAIWAATNPRRKPNFIVVLCDDLGYGDIGALGATLIKTPNIDRMAREGTVCTNFYASANLCTPSRAGLLTGRYAIRSGLAHSVIRSHESRGLPASEVTIAEALKPDYISALIGKWHLGHVVPHWPPTEHGFDLFYGLPYSHDMEPLAVFESKASNVELIDKEPELKALQQMFYARAERFIRKQAAAPFFLTLSLSAPHLPSYPTTPHAGHSKAGDYGDVVEEIDAIAGRLLDLLRELRIDRDTMVIFTSDNGPWFEGSPGTARGRKGNMGLDGGYRVPMIVWGPGRIKRNAKSDAIGMSIDLLPTFCSMAGVAPPTGVKLDGRDFSAVLTKGADSPHDHLVLFDDDDVVAIRTQRWKFVVADRTKSSALDMESRGYPQLYDMANDTAENYSLASRHPEVLARMRDYVTQAKAEFEPLRTKPSTIHYMEKSSTTSN